MGQVADAVLQRQRTIQTVLVAVILLALSLYCCGGVLLLVGPGRTNTTATVYPTVTAFPTEMTATLYPSITPFNFPTAQPLLATPTQLYLPTAIPQTYVSFPTVTPFAPTFVFPSATAIIIIPPTSTPPSTSTSKPPTAVPPTAVPPTAVPPTGIPPTAIPPTAVPPTAVPATVVPTKPPATTTPIVQATSTFYFPPTFTFTPTP
jgi:hypothetical protein